jgi:tripeptidyl-peptidase I
MPSVCPFVTSVGATELMSGASGTEAAFSLRRNSSILSSGGGFSNVFAAPGHQKGAISQYHHEAAGLFRNTSHKFNIQGRGIPDISLLGKSYLAAINRVFQTIHGTSAAAPTMASLIALINDTRLHEGKGIVGFINPVLYANPSAMNDITAGENYGCSDEHAFSSGPGWDPVTGLGTPNFEKLLSIYGKLP